MSEEPKAIKPYDPNGETDPHVKEAALRWELLRRNATFSNISRRWVRDAQFRLTFAEGEEYRNFQIHFPRCALDWMLSGPTRVVLGQNQRRRGHWMKDANFNFGPILAEWKIDPWKIHSTNLEKAVELKTLPDAPQPLRLEQAWPDTSKQFQKEFILAVEGDTKFQFISKELSEVGNYLRWVSARITRNDAPDKLPEIAGKVFFLGDHLRNLAEFHRVFALPNARNSVSVLKQHLAAIRRHFAEEGLIEARFVRHASWLGTEIAWRWFLIAEQRRFHPDNSQHMYELARLYSEDLRQRRYMKQARKDAKPKGYRGTTVSSRVIKNRRSTVVGFIGSIWQWRDTIYPPSEWIAHLRLPDK